MERYNGIYRVVCGENKDACIKAWYNNTLSEKDLTIILNPENKITNEVCFGDNGIKGSMKMSLKPDMNFDYSQTFGEAKVYTAPIEAKTTMTVSNGNCLKEVTTYPDGTISTYTTTFTSQGYSVKCHNAGGYVGTIYLELESVSLCGFFVMESHDNLDKILMEDAGMSVSEANGVLSSVAIRITESNGVYTMIEYMGESTSKTTHFKFGEEFEFENAILGMKGTTLITKNGPGHVTNVFKDHKSDKMSVWDGYFTDDQLIFKVTKPLNTQKGSITYRRYADIFGRWKMVASDNLMPGMKSLGYSDDMIQVIMAERTTSSAEYIGNGRIKTNAGSSLMPDDMIFKSGEEFSFSVGGFTVHQVFTLTRTGNVSAMKVLGKNVIAKAIVGKTFKVLEETIEGEPDTKATFIMARL